MAKDSRDFIVAKPDEYDIIDGDVSIHDDEDILEVLMINVGAGEAILIIFHSSIVWLVDGGSSSEKPELGHALAVYLKARHLKLETIIASHRHIDHVGAVEYLLQNHPDLASELRYYYVEDPPGVNKTKQWIQDLEAELKRNEAKLINLRNRNEKITITHGHALLFAGSGQKDYTSIFMHLHFKKATFLFTGDVKTKYERAILDNYDKHDFRSDVLKITHHGSETGTGEYFVGKVKPALAIGSTAMDSGHRLENNVRDKLSNCKIYETVKDGDITVRTAGKRFQGGVLYEVTTHKNGIFRQVQ